MKAFLLWWTADHIQAVKKALVMVAGIAAYLLPAGSLYQQIAALVAGGGLTDSVLGSIWKLIQANAMKADNLSKLASGNAIKALLLALSVGLLSLPAPARAAGFLDAFDYGMGPTIPLLQFPLGVKAPPVQFAPGTGVQFNVTPKALQFEWAGKRWDFVSLNVFLFGSLVTGAGGQQLGQLSVAGGLAFLSSAVALGIGGPMLSEGGVPFPGKPFLLLALNLNILLQPPPVTAFDRGSWAGLPRANALYF